mmetsp:Transcript_40150/g.92276  ORF Transcript_40150/g.92276 Transcript_40150/m.92276 type:complete len:278 (-) Transcript_40150:32-865(-)
MDLASLQEELKGAKERCADIKLGKAKKEAETFPFPVWLLHAVQRPPAAKAFDLLELPVKLTIQCLDPLETLVEVPAEEIPEQLREKIVASVTKTWAKYRGKEKAPWGIKKTLDSVEAKFVELLTLDAECLQAYEGCDENDVSMRRFALVAPAPPQEEQDEEGSDEDDDDDEGLDEDELARIALLLEEAEAGMSGKNKLTPEEVEEKRREAEEMGGKQKMLSKKEREELNKSRKERAGHRMAKTGQKAHKYEGDGAASKEERKKRNEANVKKRFGIGS